VASTPPCLGEGGTFLILGEPAPGVDQLDPPMVKVEGKAGVAAVEAQKGRKVRHWHFPWAAIVLIVNKQ
jgi:hypothetical protein